MSRRGENIYHRKDGRWEGRYIVGHRADGRPIYKSIYGKRYSEVRQRLMGCKLAAEASRGRGREASAPLFSERMVYYLECKVRPFIKESTLENYRRIAENYLLPAFGRMPLDQMETECIQTYFSGQMERLSAGTLRNIFSLLRAVLRDAHLDGKLPGRPWENVRLAGRRGADVRVLSVAEQRALEAVSLEEGRIEFVLCLYSGMRLGELCALRWRDVNWRDGALHIRGTLQRIHQEGGSKVVITTPKSQSSQRVVPVPDFIMELLRARREASAASGDDFVIQGRRGGPVDMRTVQARFARIAKALGIEGAHIHTLRHTYATRCMEAGLEIGAVSALLGHSTAAITLKYYVHCVEQRKWSGIRKLAAVNASAVWDGRGRPVRMPAAAELPAHLRN